MRTSLRGEAEIIGSRRPIAHDYDSSEPSKP